MQSTDSYHIATRVKPEPREDDDFNSYSSDIKMELDNANSSTPVAPSSIAEPPPYSPSASHGQPFNNVGGLPVECFIKNVDDYLDDGPSIPTKQHKPPARQLTSPPSQRLPPGIKSNSDDQTRVVGERSTTNYIGELYEYISRHSPHHQIKDFEFKEPYQQQFSVILHINGLLPIEPAWDAKGDDEKVSPKLFPSKKAAKECVCEIALNRLKSIPKQPEQVIVGSSKLKGESAMGELNRYCSMNGLPRPAVLDTSNSRAPYYFGCQVTIMLNGEHTFGDGNPVHPNKKAAQNVAARLALDWIHKENPNIVKTKGKSGKAARILAPGSVIQLVTTGKTVGEVAVEACVQLGFKAPSKTLEPVDGMPGMYNVWITVEHSDQTTRVGPMKNIFGQKNAKEEAMKVTLRTVELLAQSRFGIRLELIGQRDFELFQ